MSVDLRARRSKFAVARVGTWKQGDKLKDQVKALPVLVRTMGVASAVALHGSKADSSELASALVAWLTHKDLPGRLDTENADVSAFLRRFTRLNDAAAAYLDNEGLRFAETLKLISGALHAK